MAVWFARQTANINAANVWNSAADGSGSWLTWPPATGDVLMANGFNVTVNVNTNLGATGQVRTDTANGATAGGQFNMSNGITLTANVFAGSTACVYSAAATVTVVGALQGGNAANAHAVFYAGTGTCAITGNISGGSIATARGAYNSLAGTINITGNLSSSVNNTAAAFNNVGGTINITGDGAGCTVSGAQAATVWNNSTGTVTITGNITGDVGWGAHQYAAGVLTISGYAQASNTAPAINNNALGTVTVGETRSASNGRGAVIGAFRYASATAAVSKPIVAGTQKTISVLDVATLVPSENTVRAGVDYGDGAYTGTLALPRKRKSMIRRF